MSLTNKHEDPEIVPPERTIRINPQARGVHCIACIAGLCFREEAGINGIDNWLRRNLSATEEASI